MLVIEKMLSTLGNQQETVKLCRDLKPTFSPKSTPMFRLILSHHFFQWISIHVYIFASGQCRKVHVTAHLAVVFSSTLGWRPIAWRQARDWSQEGDITAWGNRILSRLTGTVEAMGWIWTESSSQKYQWVSKEIAQATPISLLSTPMPLMSLERFC